jgi:arylsulfotransferase ASST
MPHATRLVVLCSMLLSLGLCAAASASTVTISPLPGTQTAMPRTQISFLGAPAGALQSISVLGSVSGRHSGQLRAYSSATGASFVPSRPFTPGERVSVHASLRSTTGALSSLASSFTIATPAAVSLSEFPSVAGGPADVQSFVSQPELHPPTVSVHQQASPGSAPGYVFAAPFLGPGQYGPMIFDSAGNLVWFHPLPAGQDATDLRTQIYHGKNDLTWWQGRTIQLGYGLGKDVIADSNYKAVAIVKAGNGLKADEHEFTLTPQGSAYVLAYSPVESDLSSAGGAAHGIAIEGVIQEIDIHTGLVMWEWHSSGNVALSESYSKPPAVAGNAYDYFHVNSLALDRQGNLLVSARNTWALYDIDSRTGHVMWRLGGKKSSFALAPGVAFAYQHNAQWLPDGNISLFDDEGAPSVQPPSRGEIVKLDVKHKTATLAAQLVRAPGPLSTGSQGDVQSLPGGGWMVGWGGLPNLTEFNAQGQVLYDAQLPTGENSYRVYREPWVAQPASSPAIAARTRAGSDTVYASWNGATTVVSWQLLTGSSSAHLTAVSTTPRRGFETTIPAPSAAFFQVRALSASGAVLGSSPVTAPIAG